MVVDVVAITDVKQFVLLAVILAAIPAAMIAALLTAAAATAHLWEIPVFSAVATAVHLFGFFYSYPYAAMAAATEEALALAATIAVCGSFSYFSSAAATDAVN